MKRSNRGLVVALVLLRVAAAVALVAGVGLALWNLAESDRSQAVRISTIVDIGLSLLIGIGFYSLGELINYLLEAGAQERILGKD